ncbi:MAG: CDP-glycerol glycerophosphotransferase family protein [Oscillospiraceae bacterium]|nr:CDP-glycerol glycerophosphotransferase family protein [Oscillospiraceae bacterium]
MPLKKNKILFWADNFKSFGCSPKYIATRLARECPGKYDLVWVLERGRPIPEGLPEGIRIVRYFSMQYLQEIATAKVIICNHRTGPYHRFEKRKGQYYIQTWHSSLRLKKIEGDAPLLEPEYVAYAKADSQKIDLLLSGCRFSTDIFRRAFWYDGEILECGTPRCDGFFGDTEAVREKVFSYYNIPKGKKLALYAPTFRKDGKPSLYGFSPEAMAQSLGDGWVIGCRLHPNLAGSVDTGCGRNMTGYPDMQELLQSCDLLITDYSSSMFDMAIAGKACVLYMPDLSAYQEKERGLYFDVTTLPFPKAETMEALCRCMETWDEEGYKNGLQAFCRQIGSFETGTAAQTVAQRLETICFGRIEK